MYQQTLCFIKRNNEILMLNRNSSPLKGLWNGIGGKVERDETPIQCVQREVKEETTLDIPAGQFQYKGIIYWKVDDLYEGGLHAFLVDFPEGISFPTPRRAEEGILEWKRIEWLFEKDNLGVGEMIPYYLPELLWQEEPLVHKCYIRNKVLFNYTYSLLKGVEE
ncbi:NUDIX hydrolase [Halobacillus litoralis]|uniref:DNA mismatch repair protein MutT n=1 Tax=Halobacillus litoralis TaxID=45668 RepID=A0A410MI20_9BACI|nr:8-oxo-dGTP diphosphatase [Halobacillus litoralis]QAS54333.1 DNA mismatch repair protein MutT [Halobacillus litoralis]